MQSFFSSPFFLRFILSNFLKALTYFSPVFFNQILLFKSLPFIVFIIFLVCSVSTSRTYVHRSAFIIFPFSARDPVNIECFFGTVMDGLYFLWGNGMSKKTWPSWNVRKINRNVWDSNWEIFHQDNRCWNFLLRSSLTAIVPARSPWPLIALFSATHPNTFSSQIIEFEWIVRGYLIS